MGKICSKCGFDNPDEAVFCESCGSKITEDVKEEETAVDEMKKVEEPKNEGKTSEVKGVEKKQEADKKAEGKKEKDKKQIALSRNVLIGIGAAIAVVVVLLIVLIVVIASKGCGDGKSANKATKETEVTEEVIWENDEDSDSEDNASGDVSTKDIKVVDEYNIKGDYYHCFVVVKNNAKTVASVSGKGLAYDSSDKIIGTSEPEALALGPGDTSVIDFYVDNGQKVKKMKYSFEVEEDEYATPEIKYIKSKYEKVGNEKIIVTVKNTSKRDLSDVKGVFLFFDHNKLVDYNEGYVGDSNDMIKKGKVQVQEIDCYKKFDSVKMFFSDSTEDN